MTEACRVCPARLVEDTGHLLGASLGDLVPPEAQLHLVNAQRELLLALMATIEHNTTRARRTPAKRGRRRSKAASARKPKRVALD